MTRVERAGLAITEWPWLTERRATIVNLAQIAAWAVLGASVLLRTGHFTYDQAYFYEVAIRTAEALRFPAYGPFVSGVHPSPLTPGGLLYAVMAVPFLVFRDPRFGMAWLHLLGAAGLVLFDRALRRLEAPALMRVTTLFLFNWAAYHARWLETFWNGDLFLFTTPALLYLTSRLATGAPLRFAAGFGLVAALSVQTHLSGGMAVLVCAGWLVAARRSAISVRHAGVAVAALALGYVPFVVMEVRSNYLDWFLLQRAAPGGGFNSEAIVRSLLSPVMYVTQAELPAHLLPPFERGWVSAVACFSGVLGVALTLIGLATRYPLKLATAAVLLGLPLYFRLNGRGYQDHYVASVVPFVLLLPGAGAAYLLGALPRWRPVLLGVLALHAAGGIAILITQLERPVLSPGNPWNRMTVAFQLEQTERALASGLPLRAQPGDEGAFVKAVLARRMFGKELPLQMGSRRCGFDLLLDGVQLPLPLRPHGVLVPLADNSVFTCD